MCDPGDQDSFSDLDDFRGLTEEDFAKLDATVAALSTPLSAPNGIHTTQAHGDNKYPPPEIFPSSPLSAAESFRSDFGGVHFNAISAQDLARLDAEIASQPVQENEPLPSVAGQPTIDIALEDDPTRVPESTVPPPPPRKPWHMRTPMEQFRPKGILSVTDLVSPLWCEVQYDYGLRGRRSRPLERRPASFTSSSGKVIKVEKKVAEVNDVITKQGLAVHKELEKEIKSQEISVEVTTEETRWALRLVNLMACFSGMLDEGFTREMPIFGIIEDTVVAGIIDEVVKEDVALPSPGTKKARLSTGSPQQSSPAIASNGVLRPSYTLRLKDSKTRGKPSLPSDDDSESGRFQLMVYRRLAAELMSIDSSYDFDRLWAKLNVNPSFIFPTRFLVQAGLITSQDGFQSSCLNDLAESWHKLLRESNVVGIHPELELIYRLRPHDDFKGKRKAPSYTLPPEPAYPGTEDDPELARAILLSLQEANKEAGMASTSVDTDNLNAEEDAELQKAIQLSLLDVDGVVEVPGPSKATETRVTNPAPLNPPRGVHIHEVIGSKVFLYDEEKLQNHLVRVMQWWRGERKPEGVSLNRTYRCKFCEYEADCEWREAKAQEFQQNMRRPP